MRADMAAAYLDYSDTAAFAAAVSRGEAPSPSSMRGSGRRREPIWGKEYLDAHVAPLAPRQQDDISVTEDLKSLA